MGREAVRTNEVYAGEDPKTRNDRWKDFKNPYLNSEEEFVTKKKK